MPIREECIANLVTEGSLTLEEAETLFTVDELKEAYHACARELIDEAVKKIEKFDHGTRSANAIDIDACELGDEAAYNFTLAAFLMAKVHLLNKNPLSERGEEFYCDNIRAIIEWRSGEKPPLMIGIGDMIGEIGGFDREFHYEDVLKYLPEKNKTPFERPEGVRHRFDLAHFHFRPGTA